MDEWKRRDKWLFIFLELRGHLSRYAMINLLSFWIISEVEVDNRNSQRRCIQHNVWMRSDCWINFDTLHNLNGSCAGWQLRVYDVGTLGKLTSEYAPIISQTYLASTGNIHPLDTSPPLRQDGLGGQAKLYTLFWWPPLVSMSHTSGEIYLLLRQPTLPRTTDKHRPKTTVANLFEYIISIWVTLLKVSTICYSM